MPELPEVEIVKLILEKQITGKKIANMIVFYPNIIRGIQPDALACKLKGQVIRELKRFGKYLVFILDRGSLIIHLRMEGKFYLKPKDEAYDKHEHIIFEFTDKMSLRYHDTRKFGTIDYVSSINEEDILQHPALARLGKDANLIWEKDELFAKIRLKTSEIKSVLLDQSIIAGLGNIYVNEVCFLAKIHPAKIACTITRDEANLLSYYAKYILDEAITCGGTTIRSYTSSLGVTGRFQQYLKVHNREGEACYLCQGIIKKIRIGGRGTYFCPNCQVHQIKRIAITGGIASGKSTVVSLIKEMKYPVWEADKVVHELYEQKEVADKLALLFPESLSEDKIDRKIISEIVYADPKRRKTLENLIHPLVYQNMNDWLNLQSSPLVFLDIPLLFETKQADKFEDIILVDTPPEIALERLMKRDNITYEYAIKKQKAQMEIADKRLLSKYIIDNSGRLEDTKKQIKSLIKHLKY